MLRGILLALGLVSVIQASAEVSVIDPVDRTQKLKAEILTISLNQNDDPDLREQARVQLNQLIGELSRQSQPVNEKRWRDHAPGSWQKIWSDEADEGFYYLSVQGWGYQFVEKSFGFNQVVTLALFFQQSFQGSELITDISKAYVREGALQPGESIGELSHKIKTGAESGFNEVVQEEGDTFVSKKTMNLLYLDESLKIGIHQVDSKAPPLLSIYRRIDRVGEEPPMTNRKTY